MLFDKEFLEFMKTFILNVKFLVTEVEMVFWEGRGGSTFGSESGG